MSLPKFSVKVQKKICAYIEAGNFIAPSCIAAGISYDTFKRWMRWGRLDGPKYKKYNTFRTAIKTSRAKCEISTVQALRTASLDPAHWRAGAWLLERSFRERWKPPITRALVTTNAPTPADALQEAEDRALVYRAPSLPNGDHDGAG